MMQMRKLVTYAALAVGLVAAAAFPAVAAHIGGGGMGGGVHMGGGMGHSMGPMAHAAPMGHIAHAGPMGHIAHSGPMGNFAHASPMGHMAHVRHVGPISPMGGPRRVANFHDHDQGHHNQGHHHGHNRFFIAGGYPYFYNDYYYETGYGGCDYLYSRAARTGSSYWWHRYEECIY